jgi:hypothetical protein
MQRKTPLEADRLPGNAVRASTDRPAALRDKPVALFSARLARMKPDIHQRHYTSERHGRDGKRRCGESKSGLSEDHFVRAAKPKQPSGRRGAGDHG